MSEFEGYGRGLVDNRPRITEHADDSPTGKLMVAVIGSVDEFYSENLARNVPPIY